MGELSLSRYEIRRVLGRGGMGVVYEAFDTRSSSTVALKTIRHPAPDALLRLKQEFRSLADLQHPNLVRFGELTSENGQWFFTMELVRGTSFLEYVRADGGPLDERRLRSALPQLVSALCAVHDAGHVHRDVKPSNVLVTCEGRVVLLDFGLATALQSARADEGVLEGTPAFMAPEQIGGGRVGPEADLYALGGMVFLALTGALPFSGGQDEILNAKLNRDAPAPRTLDPTVPVDLDELCTELLRVEPERRASAGSLRARLGLPDTHDSTTRRATPFVGRERELAALRVALEDACSGRGRLVVIEGEPGVGKSALVHRFLDDARRGALVLRGRCYEQESMPFKGVDAVVDALSDLLLGLPEQEVEAVAEGGLRYLSAVFPVLNRVPKVAAATSGRRNVENPLTLREQAFGELSALLASLSARRALVIFLDDIQWADRDSLALLRHLLGGASAAPCLIVATLRSDVELPDEGRDVLASAERIVLGGLSDAEAGVLWDALWQTSRDRDPAHHRAMLREAGGHPLFLAELARSARAGHHERGHGRLLDVLWERVCERDEVERLFLEMVALAGAPTPFEVIARAAGIDVGECATRLGALRAAQLVRVGRRGDERVVEPYHDRLRESVMTCLRRPEGAADLAARHVALGNAILAATPEDALPQRVFSIVKHLNAAQHLVTAPEARQRLAELNLLAAREARLATAYASACVYARAGLALLDDAAGTQAHGLARDLTLERMNDEYLVGEHAVAQRLYEDVLARSTSAVERADIAVAWIALETVGARPREALAAGRQALRELGQDLPARANLTRVLGQYAYDRLLTIGRDVEELLHLPTLEDERIAAAQRVLVALAPPAFFADNDLLTWLFMRSAGLSMRHGLTEQSSFGIAGYGVALSAGFGKHREGAAFGTLALALNERFQNDRLAAKVLLLNGGFLSPWVAPFEEGKRLLRAAHESARKHGDTSYEAYSAAVLAMLTYCESADLVSTQGAAEWARSVCERRGHRDMTSVVDVQARHVAALRGLVASPEALYVGASAFTPLGAPPAQDDAPTAWFWYHFCCADLAFHFGHPARAANHLAEAAKSARTIFGMPVQSELCLLDGLVAARLHDSAGPLARRRLRKKLTACVDRLRVWADTCPANFAADHLVGRGELARIRGAADEADEQLARAVTAARGHRSPKREALALELAARNAAARGDGRRAATLVESAADAYQRWGAEAKARALLSAAGPMRQ